MPASLVIPSPSSHAPSAAATPGAALREQQQATAAVMKQSQAQSALLAAIADTSAAEKRARARAPRNFITKAELEACSGYLVGRLTQDKVNSAVEEIAGA